MDISIKIESLAYNGYGVGKDDSKVIFVDYAVPGDTVEVEIYENHKNYAFGKIKKILTQAKDRIEPACKHFEICGGCSYLNMPYEVELEWKNQIFKSAFNRAFKDYEYCLDSADDLFKEANIGNDYNKYYKYNNYRQKISLKVRGSHIGFYKKQSHQIVDVEYCLLANKEINEMLKIIQDELNLNPNVKNLSSITLSATDEIRNALIKSDEGFSEKNDYYFKRIAQKCDLNNIFVEYRDRKLGNCFVKVDKNYFTLRGLKFYLDLPSFMQVNKNGNETLINTIVSFIKDAVERRGEAFSSALDLFCGFGNITMFLSGFSKKTVGVDIEGFSIELAKRNLILNDIKNIDFIGSNAEDFLKKEVQKGVTHDIVVLDPPRAGIKGLAPQIAMLNPELVIYVSCDPTTLIRDLKEFVVKGYAIKKIKLIDMFPRTYHIESVVFLERIKPD